MYIMYIVVTNMIDLTASDDVESSPNVERNFQRLFPSMHWQAEMVAPTAFPVTVNSLQ